MEILDRNTIKRIIFTMGTRHSVGEEISPPAPAAAAGGAVLKARIGRYFLPLLLLPRFESFAEKDPGHSAGEPLHLPVQTALTEPYTFIDNRSGLRKQTLCVENAYYEQIAFFDPYPDKDSYA
jgi:hypothetical protein